MDANIVFSLVVRKALTKEHAVVGKKTSYIYVGFIYKFLKI